MATPDELREKLRKMREAEAAPSAVETSKPTADELRAKLKTMRAEAPTPAPDARSRRDYASAHPEETLAAVEIARAQVERTLIEDGMEPNAARAKSFRDAAGMMLTRPSRAAEANIRASEEMPSLTGTATRVLAPGVRAVEPHPTTKREREAQYRSEVNKIDASLGNLQGAVDAFHTAWEGSTPPMSTEDYKASVGDKDWLQGAKQAAENIGRMNIGTVTLGLLGDLPTVDRLKAQASLVGDIIDNLSADPDLPKVVSVEGYGEIAKRAAVKAGAPDAAAFVGEHLGLLKPREANALRQDAIDARPAEHFDMLAPRIHEAATSDDPEAWAAGLDALLSLPPSIIPDKDVINSPDVSRFRAAIEATPDAFDDEAWAGVKQRVKQKAGDTEVELALRQVPLGALVGVQPDLMPDMGAIARLVERRDAARKKWGGATTEALERLVTAAAITPATKEGLPVYVESMPAQVMRLAGTAFEMLAEADVPAYDLNPTAWAIAAIGDVAGAKDFTAHVRNARLPTKRGLDVMLSSGAYDDLLSMAGLGPYRPLLGNDSSSWGARVLADVIYPEFQGLGLSATAERAGMDPTSTLATTLDVIDLGAGFLVPAEGIVAAPLGVAARVGLRARQGARAMPKGYKLRGAAAKAVPSVWSAFSGEKLLDIDGDTALHHALLSAVEQETKAGREVKIPAPYWDSVKAAARSIGADPDVLLAETKKSLERRRARTFENMQDMVAREATPEMEALRKHPEYVRVANEMDAMVKAGVMPADKALGALMMDEVRAFLSVDAGIYATPEDYFASVQREVGGAAGAGAYFQGENTPEFKAWFGDSKMVDENGAPLVYHHGSPERGFGAFDLSKTNPNDPDIPVSGFHFSSDFDDARAAGSHPWGRPDVPGGGETRSFYLALRNPASRTDAYRTLRNLPEDWRSRYPDARSVHDAVRLDLERQGFDGLVMSPYEVPDRATFESTGRVKVKGYELVKDEEWGGVDLYKGGQHITGYGSFDQAADAMKHGHAVAFRPEQVKSIHNRGTFDPNDPNILHQTVGPTIRGSIESRTVGYLQRFFQTADFNTLLHEDGHLLRFLFGDRWTSELAKHFEHTVDPQGFTVLTRKGEEQAAEALRLYMRSRTHPNGRLRAKLEDSYYALQDLYLRMRGQTPNLPVELRAMWDATLRPDDAIRPSAILLADHEIPGPRPMSLLPPRTPEGDIVAVGENRMARAGRKAEAEKVLVDRARVRQAIGLPEAVQEADPEKLLGQLIAFVGVERARQGIQGEDWVKLTDRSMVPKGRLERIRRAVKGDLRLVLGTDDWLPLIDEANQTIRLDAPQAAAMRGLITDLANEPYGATLPKSVTDFDGNPGAMSLVDWDIVQAHLADRHAGVGSSMDQRVWANRGPLLGAFLRSMKDVVVDADTTKQAEKLAQDADRKFRVDVSAAQYMAPGVRDAYEGFIRSLGESGRVVVGWIRQATEAPGGATKTFGEIAKDVLPHLAPPIDPTVAPDLLSWSRAFRGEGELARTGGVSGLNIDAVTDDNALTKIGTVLQSANGITDDERVALLALHRTRGELAALGPDPLVRADYFLKNGPVIADAVSIVETGLRRRSAVVERQARQLWLSLAGSTDEAVWLRLGVDENATKPEDNAYIRAYQLFHDGDWNGMFRLADERAQLMVGGHEYNQGQAILSMFTRLYTEQLWTNFTHSLYDMGIDLDVDKAAIKGVSNTARLPKSYELGSRRGGRDVFARKVLDNIQTEVGWKNRERLIENPVEGGPRTFEPAEGAPGPKGIEDMEAYAKAQQILHQLGWKYGKGAFDASPVLLPDGSEVYLPQMMTAEVAGVIDRVAKVGVAFADTTSGGAGIFGAGERRLAQVVPPDAKTAAEIRMRQGARLGGAVTGGVLGALAAGPIGAMAGAAFGSRLAPTMAETAGSFARTAAREATDMGAGALARPAAVAAGAVGAVAGAVKGSTGAAIGTLLSTFHTTTSLARVGMTTGLLIPNISSFVGNLWGAFFQTYQVRGLSGALRAWGTNPRMLGDVVGRLWGDGPMRYRLGSKPVITPDGRILTAEMIARDFVAHGLDSSFPKSESAEAMSTDVARRIGTWPQRFLEDPADALGAPPRWIQHQLTEAWTSIDNMNRVAVYVDALHEGRSVAEAAEIARLAAFDYGNLTDFERSVMRNTVLFYSFMRQNIRLFWHTMIHDPHRVLAQLRLAGGLQREFVEDEPYLTFPDYAQGRLVLDFRKAAIDAFGSQQGVATLSPPMPAMDVVNLTSDLLGMALGSEGSAQELTARFVPAIQGVAVAAFNIDPWSGRDLSGQSSVPDFLVEGDRMATGGIVVDTLLGVRRVFDEAKGQYVYKAGNEKMWWFYRNVLQLPPAGRSMSTMEQIDRAAPFGSQPISDVVGMLRTYREGGGSETLDAFFAGPAHAAATAVVGGDPLAPYVFEAPSNVDDLAEPRPGVDVGEERRKLLGFPTTTIPTVEAKADTIHAQVRRQAQKAGNKARSGEDFK